MEQDLLWKTKQRKKKQRITLVVICLLVLGIAGGLAVNHSGALSLGKDRVTVEIRCDSLSADTSVLKNQALKEYVPEDGCILPATEYAFEKDETVYDALAELCKSKKIHMESKYDSVYQSYYVKGINHLYEFSAGKRSGWTFQVNGKTPNYGANKVKLKKGDRIVWTYVVDFVKSH